MSAFLLISKIFDEKLTIKNNSYHTFIYKNERENKIKKEIIS